MIQAVLTDIEGTTSSIRFVKDVLFPHARERLPAFITLHADEPEVQHWLHEAAEEAGLVSAERQELIELLLRWMGEDRKSTALKALQGMIWREGYEDGTFRAHVYPEVAARLRAWKAAGLRLYVYSSGSVEAQQLFFGHCEAGDLAPLFDGWFDTQVGPKREAASYRAIAESIGLPPGDILFLSDIAAELDAAREAGLRTTLLVREPGAEPAGSHTQAADFDAVQV